AAVAGVRVRDVSLGDDRTARAVLEYLNDFIGGREIAALKIGIAGRVRGQRSGDQHVVALEFKVIHHRNRYAGQPEYPDRLTPVDVALIVRRRADCRRGRDRFLCQVADQNAQVNAGETGQQWQHGNEEAEDEAIIDSHRAERAENEDSNRHLNLLKVQKIGLLWLEAQGKVRAKEAETKRDKRETKTPARHSFPPCLAVMGCFSGAEL